MNFDSVRAKIRNKSQSTGIKADILYRRFMLERFIARIAVSKHTDSMIIKGGMLISAIAGIDMRSTRDLDTTIKGKNLTIQDYETAVKDIISEDINDGVSFEYVNAEEIIIDSSYPCCRIHLRVKFGTMDDRVSIDVTSGDVITPHEVKFGFPTLLGGENTPVLAYPIETVIAEKITAMLDLSVYNTRAKDFYDIYLITALYQDLVNKALITDAIKNTMRSKGKIALFDKKEEIISLIADSPDIQDQWKRYSDEYSYADGIAFSKIIEAIYTIFSWADE